MIIMDPNNEVLKVSMTKLQTRKEILEAKLLDKCTELKKLCFAEAELTGTLPIETPFDTDESPPKIRRRVGTMFPFTDEIIKELSNNNIPTKSSPKRKVPWGRTLSLLSSNDTNRMPKETQVAAQIHQSSSSPGQQQRHTWASGQPTARSRIQKAKLNMGKKWKSLMVDDL